MKSLRIHPATFVFILLLMLTGYSLLILPYFFAVILHECGHAFVAKKLGYSLNKIYILPYGASLSFNDFAFSPHDEIKIALAGPLVNIFLIIITMAFWWIIPEIYVYTYSFALSNFSLAAFNLLPAYPLDGGRVLIGLLSLKNKRQKAFKISTWSNVVISFFFLALFILSLFFGVNFSYLAISLFLILGVLDSKFQGKYSPLLYQFSVKNKKEINQVKHIYVNGEAKVYKIVSELNKHKFNVIYVALDNGKIKTITENELETILMRASPNSTIKDAIK